jgi:cell division protein FtsI/penicillin-binding protein 2
MRTSRVTRLRVLAVTSFALILAWLCWPMWWRHEVWLVRSYQNRWTFRDVPARRGAVRDAIGRGIAWDEPGFDLEIRYRAFRRGHPVGIALHGAQLLAWARAGWRGDDADEGSAERPAPVYRYAPVPGDGTLGVRHALEALLDVPFGELRDDGPHAPRVARDLRFYAGALLAALDAGSARDVARALRDAVRDERRRDEPLHALFDGVGGRARATAEFRARVEELREIGRRIAQRDRAVAAAAGEAESERDAAVDPSLAVLDLDARREQWRSWARFRDLPESQRRALRDPLFHAFLADEAPELTDPERPIAADAAGGEGEVGAEDGAEDGAEERLRPASPPRDGEVGADDRVAEDADPAWQRFAARPEAERDRLVARFRTERERLEPDELDLALRRDFLAFVSREADGGARVDRVDGSWVDWLGFGTVEAASRERAAAHPWRRYAGLPDDERAELRARFTAEQLLADASSNRPPELLGRPPLPWNEDVPWAVRRRLDFELAAWIARLSERHPGFGAQPSVRRERATLPGLDDLGSLEPLIGAVQFYDARRAVEEHADAVLDRQRAEDRLTEPLADPSGLLGEHVLASANASLRRHLERYGRVGTRGVERAFDAVLRGDPGLRLIERDKRARESGMLGRLDVAPGRDVRLTFDLELQARAEAVLARHDEGAERAAAVIDAETGDVLLLVGAPRVDEQTGEPLWRSVALFPNRNLALGSVVKPFVLLEHLDALRHGREAALEFPACEGAYPSVPRVRCDGIHGNAARDPVYALAHSCNVFFCHAATELQNEGLARAYARFGLCDPPQHEGADVVPSSVQRDIVGLRRGDHHRPGWFQESLARSRRGIGYGIGANVLQVARAYAGLMTGYLPTVSIVAESADGPPRTRTPLGVDVADLALVREGLFACVEDGTARRVEGLAALGVGGKTGTAEVQKGRNADGVYEEFNNAWFAGFAVVPWRGRVRPIAFAAVAYRVDRGRHGADVAGAMIADVLAELVE